MPSQVSWPLGLPWLRLIASKRLGIVLTTFGAEKLSSSITNGSKKLMAVMATFLFALLSFKKFLIMSLVSQGFSTRLVSMIFFNAPFGYLPLVSDTVSVDSISSQISILRFWLASYKWRSPLNLVGHVDFFLLAHMPVEFFLVGKVLILKSNIMIHWSRSWVTIRVLTP